MRADGAAGIPDYAEMGPALAGRLTVPHGFEKCEVAEFHEEPDKNQYGDAPQLPRPWERCRIHEHKVDNAQDDEHRSLQKGVEHQR